MVQSLFITTSWDDGSPADLRIAELLARYGLQGTFYLPNRNSEGREVLKDRDVTSLSKSFEVGGHGASHVILTALSPSDAEREVAENHSWLEEVSGRPVYGFCYIRGRYSRKISKILRAQGYLYARTIENFRRDLGRNPYSFPTTLQFCPHERSVYLKNFVRRGAPTINRLKLCALALSTSNLQQRVERILRACESTGGVFHLWGHSWEIEKADLWEPLRATFELLSSTNADSGTNYDAYLRFHALKHTGIATEGAAVNVLPS